MTTASEALRAAAYAGRRDKRQKYGNIPTEVDGIKFDSRAEARFWATLKWREKAGEVRNVRRQVEYELAPSVVIGGRKRPPLRYIADFVADTADGEVVYDVKGAVPEAYRIKRHLMKSVHGIDIVEIRS